MRKFFSILGLLFCGAVVYFGIQFLNGDVVSAPNSSSSTPYYYDSGYASFGGDFYTYVNNNAAEAAEAARTMASNQIKLFRLMTKFFGYFLISLGGMGACLFGTICFEKNPVSPSETTPVQGSDSNRSEVSNRSEPE